MNANIHPIKLDEYPDGGPGPNAPEDAAGLDDGICVFQVTDSSGEVLLSTYAAMCRIAGVSAAVITTVLDWDRAGTTPGDSTRRTFPGGPNGGLPRDDRGQAEGRNKRKHNVLLTRQKGTGAGHGRRDRATRARLLSRRQT